MNSNENKVLDNNNNENNINNNENNINNNDYKDINYNNPNQISILHYIENPYLNKIIDSPRTLKSMEYLGCVMDDIYFLTFSEFIENYPEFRRFSKDIQNRIYEFYEDYRLNKIKAINQIRDNIIQNKIDINDKKYIGENLPMPTFSSSIKKELLKFEQMKNKDKLDLMKAVELELERLVLLKEEESKIRKTNMKKEEFQRNLQIQHLREKKELEERENRKYLQEKERQKKLAEENKKKYKIAQ